MSLAHEEDIILPKKGITYYFRSSWMQLLRPLTLTGTICPVLVGTGLTVTHESYRIDLTIGLLIAALLIQAATNMFNDYYDFKHGQDKEKWVQEKKITEKHGPNHKIIPIIAMLMILCSMGIGIWLAIESSFWILAIGGAGILCGYFYSAGPKPLCSLGLGELVGALFLGIAITLLTYIVQGIPINFTIVLAAIIFALLISSMILTNNIRDIEKDDIFRNTIAQRIGEKNAIHFLTGIIICAYICGLVLIITRQEWFALLLIFALPLAYRLRYSYRKGARRPEKMKGMKYVALHHWTFGLLFAIGIWLGLLF